jgi:hypothetical protein
MQSNEQTESGGFDKARTGLSNSLQSHLEVLYNTEKDFVNSVSFTNSFPFLTTEVNADTLDTYQKQWKLLRDLYTDETIQLDTLLKAIRSKKYNENEKKQLYLLILGYMSVLTSIVKTLYTHVPVNHPVDEELLETNSKFERLQNLTRLYIKGISGLHNLSANQG